MDTQNNRNFAQLPQQYEVPTYSYSSCSSESDENSSMYSSAYYSTPPPDPMTQRLTDMYRRNDPVACDFSSQQWSQNEPCQYVASQSASADVFYTPDLPLHAPIPLPYYSSFIPSARYSTSSLPEYPPSSPSLPIPSISSIHPDSMSQSQPHQQSIMDLYVNAPQQTFPTPSELLSELTNARESPATQVDSRSEKKVDSQRRARRRATARSIGFQPTDPDTISSHDKKRHYLQSLEGYVVYLHEQLTLVGAKPLPLERVSTYRGLSSRSIRTLLIHMENTVKELHAQTLDEEQVFLDLRKEAVDRDDAAATAEQEYRRHSSASCDVAQANYAPGSYNF